MPRYLSVLALAALLLGAAPGLAAAGCPSGLQQGHIRLDNPTPDHFLVQRSTIEINGRSMTDVRPVYGYVFRTYHSDCSWNVDQDSFIANGVTEAGTIYLPVEQFMQNGLPLPKATIVAETSKPKRAAPTRRPFAFETYPLLALPADMEPVNPN